MGKIFDRAKELIEASRELMGGVKIVSSEGSTPRSMGAVMFVEKPGEAFGTIGGGALEKYCIEKAVSEFGKELRQSFSLNPSEKGEVSMVCGGKVDVEFKFFRAEKESLSRLSEFLEGSNVGGRVVIFGAGHVASQCAKILGFLEFDVVIYDPRPELANKERYEDEDVVCASFSNIDDNITLGADDYVIIMTHAHKHDAEVLLQIIKRKCKYIGCIGSKNKMKTVNDFLRQNGISDEDIARVHSPIGLKINAETPEEIAISVAAEIILAKNT